MTYALLQPLPDTFDADEVEAAKSNAVWQWQVATKTDAQPQTVELVESARGANGEYVFADQPSHRAWRVAG